MTKWRAAISALGVAAVLCGAGAVGLAQQLPRLEPLDSTGLVTYFIADGERGSAFQAGDRELARWALGDWERSLGRALRFEPSDEAAAMVRVNWVAPGGGQYGEMQALRVNGRRGAAVFIRPDTDALGPEIAARARQDPLYRDTIVYLTCLHELGHALGLGHTGAYADIMYAFGYGGDIPEFFGRYRRQLQTRADIARVSGLSADDVQRVRAVYE